VFSKELDNSLELGLRKASVLVQPENEMGESGQTSLFDWLDLFSSEA
jgi:hypothetical protein